MDSRADKETISRRSMILGLAGMAGFSVLGARLYYLQISRAEDYRVLSEKNRFNFNVILPQRGQIIDRNGIALATNKQDFRLLMIPERVVDVEKSLAKIHTILPLGDSQKKRIEKDIKTHASFIPVLIAEQISWSDFSRLNMSIPDIPGVVPVEGQIRYYPHNGVFSHILGYVGTASAKMQEQDKDELLRQPRFRVGRTGIELHKDKILRGRAGRKKVEVNAFGRIVREWESDKIPAEPGQDVYLSIDSELQIYAASLFGEESGGLAVMDVNTGELRTLLSMPVYDNNLFVTGLTHEQFRVLQNDPRRPQFNKVIGGGYPPASTFKMAVMLAALHHRVINPNHNIFCSGQTHLGDRIFHCWKRNGHGMVNMYNSLKKSCDTYYYEIIQKLGMKKVKPFAEKLGLGQAYRLGLKGINAGIIPEADWKRKRLGRDWRMGDELNASIGQGYVLATPLQLTIMTARLANGKKKINPLLIIGQEIEEAENLDIDPEHIKFVQKTMRAVCEEPGGTAYKPNSLGDGVEMAGKTGTGQVRGISLAERIKGVVKNEDLPWKYRDHSIFVGYAPYDEPRFAAGAIVEHGGSGAKKAANIVRKVLAKALERDGLISQIKQENL